MACGYGSKKPNTTNEKWVWPKDLAEWIQGKSVENIQKSKLKTIKDKMEELKKLIDDLRANNDQRNYVETHG